MEKLTLSQIAAAVGSRCESKTEVLSICTDTRKIEPGSLFIAIQGENFDGNRFVGQAFEKGAVGAIAEHPVEGCDNVIVVADTRRALLDLARYYRGLFSVFTVGVTGSVGKTSPK